MTTSTITPPAADVRYRWKVLRAGPLWLDGGGMFGLVPRVVWSRAIKPDEQGRILVAHNCILLERVDGTGQPILIETGSGDKFDAKNRAIFGLTDYSIADAVRDAGHRCQDIGDIIVSHLHFDHAGGATRKAREDEDPDWIDPVSGLRVKRTFPNATVHVQRREWEDAIINRSVMTRTYLPENLEPLRPKLHLLESVAPFAPGYIPRRDELPTSTLESRQTAVLPGIFAILVPGHTWGQHAIGFTDERGRTVVFTPDVLATRHHFGAAYNLAYDVEPFMSTVTRRWFLQAAAAGNWVLVLDHEPDQPCQRAEEDGKGWHRLNREDEP